MIQHPRAPQGQRRPTSPFAGTRLGSAALVFLISLVLLSGAQAAQRVYPLVFELAPFGSDAQTSLWIENSGQTPTSVEIVVNSVSMTEDGTESWTPADEDFLIFPPLAVVQPGGTQKVAVQYVGDPDLKASRAFRVSVRQVPVDLSGSGTVGVAVAVNFNTLANVVPAGVAAELQPRSLTPQAEEGKWEIVLENTGTRFARFSEMEWSFEDAAGQAQVIAGNDLKGMTEGNGSNFLPPQTTRRLRIPALQGFNPTTTRINVSVKTE